MPIDTQSSWSNLRIPKVGEPLFGFEEVLGLWCRGWGSGAPVVPTRYVEERMHCQLPDSLIHIISRESLSE